MPGQAYRPRLQGSGWPGRTFVAYGPGNFLWRERSYSAATGVRELTLHPRAATTRFIPATVSGTGQPVTDRGAAARQAVAPHASLRTLVILTAQDRMPRPHSQHHRGL